MEGGCPVFGPVRLLLSDVGQVVRLLDTLRHAQIHTIVKWAMALEHKTQGTNAASPHKAAGGGRDGEAAAGQREAASRDV